jgi:hypothetical protein
MVWEFEMLQPQQVDAFLALALGFALAGLSASIFRAILQRPAGFELLKHNGMARVMVIPLLVVAGPAIIMRNTVRGRRYERRKVHFVAMATTLAGIWSIVLGVQALSLLRTFML